MLILSGMLVSLTGCGGAKSSGGEPPSYSPARILVPEAPGSQTLGSSPLILDRSNLGQGYCTAPSDSGVSRMSIQLTTPSGDGAA